MGKIGKNYLLNTVYQLCAIIVPLITAPYLTRVLMASNYGIYSYVQSTSAIVQTITLICCILMEIDKLHIKEIIPMSCLRLFGN